MTSSSANQAQQEISSASSRPVQLPVDASSSLPLAKRIVRPTAKRTAGAGSPPMTNTGEPMHPLQSSQPPERTAPRTFGLSLPSTPRTSAQEHLSPVSEEQMLPLSQALQQPQLSEGSTLLIPATEQFQGHPLVPVTPLAPVEPPGWDTDTSRPDSYDFLSPRAESIAATSKAAEHWRNSWRNRQLAEASPAMGCSRGQAPVSEPLIAMQPTTLLQPQAALLPTNRNRQEAQARDPGFWVMMITMLILLGGLAAYIASTYLPSRQDVSQLIPSIDGLHPTLTLTSTDTTALALENAQGSPLAPLLFTAVVSKGDPQEQRIYLRNTSNMPLEWTVATVAEKNLGWLLVGGTITGGTLKAQEATSITINVVPAGLKIGSYSADVIFTVDSQGQVILPVTLTVAAAPVEVVVTPNPMIAEIQSGGTCRPITLTLVNLSNRALLHWQVKGDDPYDQQHIFLNGGSEAQGSLSPSDQGGSAVALKVACKGVRLGEVYKITVYYNNIQVHVPITIRQSY